jgi:hypothetical protein
VPVRFLVVFWFLLSYINSFSSKKKKDLEGGCKIREQGEEKPRENLKK